MTLLKEVAAQARTLMGRHGLGESVLPFTAVVTLEISAFPSDSNIHNQAFCLTVSVMRNWTEPDLCILAGLYVQNEESFVVRRFVQRFLAGDMTARHAIARIRQ